ncbi:MAG: heat-inducible transcriptional repressor HrcA [Gammaproteobacteria bacterium]|nr:MAG: heat-inducible transcriptional repressor HrcA [Gammaproteobacteria bacterium]
MLSLNDRAEILLQALIKRYIADGLPVGSRTLAKQAGLDLSPATVRNVMVDLEELGLVKSPHTSAGRVPTQLGYRLFVDTLLKVEPLNLEALHEIEEEFSTTEDPRQLIATASSLLSQVTKLAAVVSVPRRNEQSGFRQIEFVGLSNNRVLVILVTHDGQVQNRIIYTEHRFSPAELVQAANYFNDAYSGHTIDEVRQMLIKEMREDSQKMQDMMHNALQLAQSMFENSETADGLVVSGESNLIDIPELGDTKILRRLFEAFTTKRDLAHLLDQSLRCAGVKIFIGNESGYEALEECSVVTAPYKMNDNIVGTLGVVGPTRMSYEHVIPIVDMTARLLSGALTLEDS